MSDFYTEVNSWYKTVEGKGIVFGGSYGVQCTELAKQYAVTKHGAPKQPYGNGKDVAYNLNRLVGWRLINLDSEKPQVGDVVSIGDSLAPPYGHVGIFMGSKNDLWTLADQGPTAGVTALRTYYKWRVVAVARPPRYDNTIQATTKLQEEAEVSQTTHTIASGDTLYSLAIKYGTSVTDIQKANPDVQATNLRVGNTLVIPTGHVYHVVKLGETMYSISVKYGTSVDNIKKLNPSINPNAMIVGTTLTVK